MIEPTYSERKAKRLQVEQEIGNVTFWATEYLRLARRKIFGRSNRLTSIENCRTYLRKRKRLRAKLASLQLLDKECWEALYGGKDNAQV